MPSELEDALAYLANILGTLQDINRSFLEPPQQMEDADFPAVIAYPYQGEINRLTSTAAPPNMRVKAQRHTVYVDIHQSRRIVPAAFTAVRVWPGRMYTLLNDHNTLGGRVSMIQWPLVYEAVQMPYGREDHYGMRFAVTMVIF